MVAVILQKKGANLPTILLVAIHGVFFLYLSLEDKNNASNLTNNQSLKQREQNTSTIHETLHVMVARPGADDQSHHCGDEEATFCCALAFPLSTDNCKKVVAQKVLYI